MVTVHQQSADSESTPARVARDEESPTLLSNDAYQAIGNRQISPGAGSDDKSAQPTALKSTILEGADSTKRKEVRHLSEDAARSINDVNVPHKLPGYDVDTNTDHGLSQQSTARGTARSSVSESPTWQYESKLAHVFDAVEISKRLDVDLHSGLTDAEASIRLAKDGPNKLESAKKVSAWKILLRQVSNSLTLVLVIAMALSFGIEDFVEGGVITAVIVLNIVIGFVQDFRAEKTMQSLLDLSAPTATVIRNNGRIETAKAENLVVGDIVRLAVGDLVPADLRLFDGINLETDEALLTGESLPISKAPLITLSNLDLAVGDRINMAYTSSTVTKGRGTGVVVATGMKTELGSIATLLQGKKKDYGNSNFFVRGVKKFWTGIKTILGLIGTPLQVKLSKFALLLFALAILLAIIVFSASSWRVNNEVLIYGICVAVAIIPESLIAVLTITLAAGTKAMAKGHVVIRKMEALEAVGGVTNICSDKTGTLTQGKMIARKAWIPGMGSLSVSGTTNHLNPTDGVVKLGDVEFNMALIQENSGLVKFLNAIALCNLATVSQSEDDNTTAKSAWTASGDPTEISLQVLAMRFHSGKPSLLQDGNMTLLAEHQFDSTVKKMSVVYENLKEGSVEVFLKGAGEAVIPSLVISDNQREQINSMIGEMAGQGLRVLCLAHKTLTTDERQFVSKRENMEAGLQFIGLVGLYDPPRLETFDAVRKCQIAGIKVHMLTGDHIQTATAIAREVGIVGPNLPSAQARTSIMSAGQFDKLTEAEVDALEELPLVIARCSPGTKVHMIEALHRRKAFCVMTGDGVNDSPALKRADVGIAMGLNGSDVAKDAADMVLTNDDFASIVKAVEEGRRLFDNIQKFLMHLLISNISQVVLLLIGLAFQDDSGNSIFPLSPLEILWVNMITSSFLAIGLGLEEAQPDIMLRRPHDLRVGVFTWELIVDKMIYGIFLGSLCLVSFVAVVYGANNGSLGNECNHVYDTDCNAVFRARATVFSVLTFLLLVTAWEVKHFSRSLFNLDPTKYKGPFAVFHAIYYNRFLFWAVVAGFAITFPVVYLPTVNTVVFKHIGITWEWGIVFACVTIYLGLIESWKAVKRAFGIGSGKLIKLTSEDMEARSNSIVSGEK